MVISRSISKALHALVTSGNTALVIEHNLEVLKTADCIIDRRPQGGDRGGGVAATGTPEDICKVSASYAEKTPEAILMYEKSQQR